MRLPDERRNGWVIAWVVETHFKEEVVVRACEKVPYKDRMEAAGLGALLNEPGKPRQKCALITKATEQREALLEEHGQRRKIDYIRLVGVVLQWVEVLRRLL